MAGRKWAFGFGPSKPAEHEHVVDVDERQRRHTGHDVAHQKGQVLGVVDHESAAASLHAYLRDSHVGSTTAPRASNPRGQTCVTENQFGRSALNIAKGHPFSQAERTRNISRKIALFWLSRGFLASAGSAGGASCSRCIGRSFGRRYRGCGAGLSGGFGRATSTGGVTAPMRLRIIC